MRILPASSLITVFKRTAQRIGEDQVGDMAAALTYYAIFSLFPLLLLLVTIAGFVFNADQARTVVFDRVATFAPGDTARILSDTVGAVLSQRGAGTTILATVVGIAGLLFSSSGVFSTLDKSINRTWGCQYKVGFVKDKIVSFAMVLGIALIMLLSLAVSAALNFLQNGSNTLVQQTLGKGLDIAWLWQILELAVTIGLSTAILLVVFRTLPHCRVRWRDVWLGALLTAAAWEILKQAFAFYLGHFANSANVYGTLGAFFSLLTWIYLSGMILLTGAVFTSVYAAEFERLEQAAAGRAPTAPEARTPAARAWRGAQPRERSAPPPVAVAPEDAPTGPTGPPPAASAGVIGAAVRASASLAVVLRGVRTLTRHG